jgi:hypothetical protein
LRRIASLMAATASSRKVAEANGGGIGKQVRFVLRGRPYLKGLGRESLLQLLREGAI